MSYEVYAGPGDQPDEVTPLPDPPWQVLAEYSNGGQAKPPTLLMIFPGEHPHREAALIEAERRAREFRPPDPFSPRGRQVYRDGEGFLTVIEGAASTFHFSTRVVQRLAPGA